MRFFRKEFHFAIGLLILAGNIYAIEEHKKLWLAINTQHPFKNNQQWLYAFYSQLRLIDESHTIQTFFFEGMLGYQVVNDKSIWLGYRWIGNHPGNHFYHTHRFIEQLRCDIKENDAIHLNSRSRLEEIRRSDQHQTEIRFRERLALEFRYLLVNHIYPYLYDEVFFQLHRTNFTTHHVFSENRLFVGVNYYLTKKTWWEIGYMNQFENKTPAFTHYQLNHILSITYNF